METREARIVVETTRHRITGDVTLPREGYRSRLSDYLNRGEISFIPMVDVSIEPLNANGAPSGLAIEREFVVVSVGEVVLAYPCTDGEG